ncbi:hypothetical protein BJV78DRAFT_390147 [Lactifluus subvellereus]|nr:hypothetical protein BJV78DRAFT_390147 [Lactifluus subvellereus]
MSTHDTQMGLPDPIDPQPSHSRKSGQHRHWQRLDLPRTFFPPSLLPSFSPFSWMQDQCATALARLATAKKTLSELHWQAELEAYGVCDPVKIEEKRRAVMLAREGALRHTGQV